MATLNEQIINYLKTPGLTDTQVAADMDKYGVTVEQMAAATGVKVADVQKRYDTQKAINAYGAANPNIVETDWAKQMTKAGWTDEDIARATGVPLKEVQSRHQTANLTNDLTELKTQLAALTTSYNTLANKSTTPTPVTPTATTPLVGAATTPISTPTTPFAVTTPGATTPAPATPAAPAAPTGTSGVVYGPDGTMYSSAAAAIAAGVQNYTSTKPVGLINSSNTLGAGFTSFNPTAAGNANPGGLIGGASQQLFKNTVGANIPTTANPFMIKA